MPPGSAVKRRASAEGTYYELTAAEADTIAAATAELHAMCIAAVGRVIRDRRYREVGLDPLSAQLVERSWNRRDPALYGRMDLAFGPDGVPKLLEYNADTPTSLLEAAVTQWTWLEACAKGDQANALHEQLIARWRALRPRLGPLVHFAYVDDLDDQRTVDYLRDTAHQAGLETAAIEITALGFDPATRHLIDLEGRTITSLFKLYPWEGLVTDTLAPALIELPTLWLEPAWKLVLSNQAILPILWQLFPGHPNLLPAARELGPAIGEAWVKKPLLGREGSNVTIRAPGVTEATAGPLVERGFVYQSYTDLGAHDGMYPVIGSWLVGDVPAGIGIRETPSRITGPTARFVPHVIA
ncbi:MAG: glutathionylspermidine synthase family protein [Kofleriaceae bacterium]